MALRADPAGAGPAGGAHRDGRFGDQKALVVERFDRAWMDERQLDRAPAAGRLLPGPGLSATSTRATAAPACRMHACCWAARPTKPRDRLRFALTQLAFWLMAATDGHAKNFSVFLQRGDAYG